jgi:hypothetical protein
LADFALDLAGELQGSRHKIPSAGCKNTNPTFLWHDDGGSQHVASKLPGGGLLLAAQRAAVLPHQHVAQVQADWAMQEC